MMKKIKYDGKIFGFVYYIAYNIQFYLSYHSHLLN